MVIFGRLRRLPSFLDVTAKILSTFARLSEVAAGGIAIVSYSLHALCKQFQIAESLLLSVSEELVSVALIFCRFRICPRRFSGRGTSPAPDGAGSEVTLRPLYFCCLDFPVRRNVGLTTYFLKNNEIIA